MRAAIIGHHPRVAASKICMPRQAIPSGEFLASLPPFSELSRSAVRRIEAGVTALDVPKGAFIARRGEPCAGLHVVVFGQVKLALRTQRGDEKVVALLERGDRFGEAAMFLGEAYQVSAEALRDSMLLHIAREVVLAEIRHDPAFAQRIIEGLSRGISNLIDEVEGYTMRSAAQRVASYLLNQPVEACAAEHPAITLSATKTLIASRLNLTQEHFSRILHELATAGAIEVRGRSVLLLDAETLRRRAACSPQCAACARSPSSDHAPSRADSAESGESAQSAGIARTA
jgi:CRP/FNR family transcriptional regulator, dissimilatory nitrate respiration regulator